MREKFFGWVDQNVRVAQAALITVFVVLQLLTPTVVDLFLDLCSLALVWRLVKDD